MRSNDKEPKTKPPKGWYKLTESEREAIMEFQKETIDELTQINVDHEESELQKIWLKIGCIVNYDTFGVGKIRAKRWLYRWKRVYKIIARFKNAEERDAWINAKMEKIFGKGGYPSDWVDSLEDIGVDQ